MKEKQYNNHFRFKISDKAGDFVWHSHLGPLVLKGSSPKCVQNPCLPKLLQHTPQRVPSNRKHRFDWESTLETEMTPKTILSIFQVKWRRGVEQFKFWKGNTGKNKDNTFLLYYFILTKFAGSSVAYPNSVYTATMRYAPMKKLRFIFVIIVVIVFLVTIRI